MRNRTYGGVRGRKTKVGRKLLRFPPTRLNRSLTSFVQAISTQANLISSKNREKPSEVNLVSLFSIIFSIIPSGYRS